MRETDKFNHINYEKDWLGGEAAKFTRKPLKLKLEVILR